MMTKPALDLNGVAAFREQDRGAGVTEGVEADPRKVRSLPSGLEHSPCCSTLLGPARQATVAPLTETLRSLPARVVSVLLAAL